MSVCLIALNKQPGVCQVDVGETWRRIFANIVLKVTGPKATMACQDSCVTDSRRKLTEKSMGLKLYGTKLVCRGMGFFTRRRKERVQ